MTKLPENKQKVIEMPEEAREYFASMGRLGGLSIDRKKLSRKMKRVWATKTEEERKAHMEKATAASLEARRKKREAKG